MTSMENFDISPNIFKTAVSGTNVVLSAAVTDEGNLVSNENITDDKIVKCCNIEIDAQSLMGVIRMLLSAAVMLQEDYGVDVGLPKQEDDEIL